MEDTLDIPLKVTSHGLYCPPGDFFIDAWKAVPLCIVTHAHGDHAYWGHGRYICTDHTIEILKHRINPNLPYEILEYDKKIRVGNTWVSLHPAGHILGSVQIRIETSKSVTVISGDYKRALDSTCLPFEVVECDIFVTESTFALPIYQWPHPDVIQEQLIHWWAENASKGHPSILFCYSLGKAQRLMSLLKDQKDKKVYLHGAVQSIAKIYEKLGISMIDFSPVSENVKGLSFSQDLILAPPSASGSPWMKRFPSSKTAFASGWMEVRGTRRRKALDQGFVFSDHADWKDLIHTIEQTKARIILTTHGNSASLARYLREEKNLDARELKGLEIISDDEED
ncbi:MAG: ligase-associated DNA damage response exonuclease [Candidatus Protochlamydia sp.]|nr:ligase-associated DNA damage response exonuclease [Candidatus Protochlamydia sp.]